MKKKILKIFSVIGIMMIMLSCFSVTAFALDPPSGGGSGGGSGDVAGAIENTWNTASDQIKQVVAVFFFAKLGLAYFDYRKSGHFEWTAPAVLFACLVFTLTAPLYIWGIIGM